MGRPRNNHKVCDNCGTLRKKGQKFIGRMCEPCARYERKNGKPRPPWYYTPKEALRCRNKYCGVSLAYDTKTSNGYCGACNQFHRRTGKLRLSKYYRRNTHDPCKICGDKYDVIHKIDDRCRMCNYFLKKYGKERTQRSIDFYKDREDRCKNERCGIKLSVWEIACRVGYCGACYNFNRKYGRDRPKSMCIKQLAPQRCDCGKPAVETITVHILKEARQRSYKNNTQEETLHLCGTCYKLEMKG